MQADAVVLLGAEIVDFPSTWVKPGAAVIRCTPTLESGSVKCIVIVLEITCRGHPGILLGRVLLAAARI